MKFLLHKIAQTAQPWNLSSPELKFQVWAVWAILWKVLLFANFVSLKFHKTQFYALKMGPKTSSWEMWKVMILLILRAWNSIKLNFVPSKWAQKLFFLQFLHPHFSSHFTDCLTSFQLYFHFNYQCSFGGCQGHQVSSYHPIQSR